MTRTLDPFKQMDKDLRDFEKAMRKESLEQAKRAERRQRTVDLKYAAEALDKKHASPRSRRIVLTGLNEYYRIVNIHSKPEPESKLEQAVPGLVLDDVVEQPVAWLWQHYIPLGALTLLEGDPGSGTSLLALHIAACLASGRPLPGGQPGLQGTVLLVAGQDHPGSTIKPRFLAAGGDPTRVLLLHSVEQVDSEKVTIEDRPFSLAQDLRFLEEAVSRTHAAFVILDSLDTCRPGELRQALPALTQLAQRSGCAILLVCPIAPTRAAAAPKPGSLELLKAVRSGLRILSDPEDREHQRLLVVTKHALCAQPGILSFQLRPSEQGVLTLDWLGSYANPTPPYEDGTFPPLSGRNQTLLRQRLVSALESSTAPLNARSLTTLTGFNYELVRKTLQRMVDRKDLLSPARGLYTTPAHPWLEHHTPEPNDTPPAEPLFRPIKPVSGEPQQAAAQKKPPEPPAPAGPASSASPDPVHDQEADPQTTSVSTVSSVPGASTTPATLDPVTIQDAGLQVASVSTVSSVPDTGSTPSTPAAGLTTPDEPAGAWKSDRHQQPDNP